MWQSIETLMSFSAFYCCVGFMGLVLLSLVVWEWVGVCEREGWGAVLVMLLCFALVLGGGKRRWF